MCAPGVSGKEHEGDGNQRHEPYAEFCCLDWQLGQCLDRQCDAYHREPEGEALACFNRLPTFEEFKRASNMRRVVYLWPEQDLVTSGFWRRNGDETLCFQNGPRTSSSRSDSTRRPERRGPRGAGMKSTTPRCVVTSRTSPGSISIRRLDGSNHRSKPRRHREFRPS